MRKYKLETIADTMCLGETLGKLVSSGDCLVLTGELGAGKTAFTKGFALGLDIAQMVKSPTYTIVREYNTGRLPLYHMDVYRIEEGGDELGLEEYFESDGVSVVEWGQQIRGELPESYLEVILSYTDKENQREVAFQPVGKRSEELLEMLRQKVEAIK